MRLQEITAVILLSAVLASPVPAQMGPPPADGDNPGMGERGPGEFKRGGMQPGMEGRMAGKGEILLEKLLSNPELQAELGLTGEQISSLRNGLDELRKKEIDLRAELEKTGIDQAKLMTSDEPDEDAIMAIIDKTTGITGELAKLRAKKLLMIKKTVTPEQLENIREKMRARIRERMQGPGRQDQESPGHREKFRDQMRQKHSKQDKDGSESGGKTAAD